MSTPSPTAGLPLVVGLTTLPSRIRHIRPALDSLRDQTRVPDKVLLCLPARSRREGCGYERPPWLDDYAPWLEVVDVESDDGPGTKLLGCIGHIPDPACLVIADDDMRYRPFFLDVLYRAQVAAPQASFSFYTYPCPPFMVGQGADGFSFHSDQLAGIREFASKALVHRALWMIDDLWISAFLFRRGIAVSSAQHLIPGGGLAYEQVHQLNQLQNLEGDLRRTALLTEGVRNLLESGLMGRRRQAEALLKAGARRLLRRD